MTVIICPICGMSNEIIWERKPGGGDAWEGDFADGIVRFRWHVGNHCPHFISDGGVNSAEEVAELAIAVRTRREHQ